jgi:hypothetical protein
VLSGHRLFVKYSLRETAGKRLLGRRRSKIRNITRVCFSLLPFKELIDGTDPSFRISVIWYTPRFRSVIELGTPLSLFQLITLYSCYNAGRQVTYRMAQKALDVGCEHVASTVQLLLRHPA